MLQLSIVVCVAVHIGTIALSGTLFGAAIMEWTLGFGPILARVGRVRIRLIPLSVSVRFLMQEDAAAARDHSSRPCDTTQWQKSSASSSERAMPSTTGPSQ
ncbi:MAG TPA: hypothetical protein VGN52_13810 [Burkholderiales bacterium]